MSNPFSVLPVSYGEDLSTENPQRKLAKMRRKYEQKPTPELKKRIQEMDSRLNSKPKKNKKKKKKKKNDDIDLEEEYQKNRKYWQEYYKKQQEEDFMNKKRKQYERERQRDRERERETSETSFHVSYDQKILLPQDIQDFISSDPPDKKTYNKLSKIYHPDKGGDEEMFKIINNHMN